MTLADNDSDWSKKVADRYNHRCAWPGCKSTFGLGAHHIIPRGLHALRLVLDNGVELCTEHHELVETAKGTKRYDIIITMLVGKKRYAALKDMEADALLDIAPVNMELDDVSSEVEF